MEALSEAALSDANEMAGGDPSSHCALSAYELLVCGCVSL